MGKAAFVTTIFNPSSDHATLLSKSHEELSHYSLVSDDSDATYVYLLSENSEYVNDLFSFESMNGAFPEGAEINYVTLHARAMSDFGGSNQIQFVLSFEGENMVSDGQTLPEEFIGPQLKSHTWTENPFGFPWNPDELWTIKYGFSLRGLFAGRTMYCYKFYIEVGYSVDDATKIVSYRIQ